jgi:hypothetical protein
VAAAAVLKLICPGLSFAKGVSGMKWRKFVSALPSEPVK